VINIVVAEFLSKIVETLLSKDRRDNRCYTAWLVKPCIDLIVLNK